MRSHFLKLVVATAPECPRAFPANQQHAAHCRGTRHGRCEVGGKVRVFTRWSVPWKSAHMGTRQPSLNITLYPLPSET